MMKTLTMFVAASVVLFAQQPPGDTDCAGCHTVDRQVVGPSYSSIAQRYAGQNDAVDKLAARIRDGGNGMTAHPGLTEPQRNAMAEWILSQKAAPATVQSAAKQYPHTSFSIPTAIAAMGRTRPEVNWLPIYGAPFTRATSRVSWRWR
jgi:cytochrome c